MTEEKLDKALADIQTLNRSVDDLRDEFAEFKLKKKDNWDKFTAMGTVLLPFAIALLGWMFSMRSKEQELQSSKRSTMIRQGQMINSFLNYLTDSNTIKKQLAITVIRDVLDHDMSNNLLKVIAKHDTTLAGTLAGATVAYATPGEKDVLDEWVIKVDECGSEKEAGKRLQAFKEIYASTKDNAWTEDILQVRAIDASEKWLIVIDAFTGPSDSVTVDNEIKRLKTTVQSTREIKNSFGRWINGSHAMFYDSKKFINLYGKL